MGQLRGGRGPNGSSYWGEATIRNRPQVDDLPLPCPWWLPGSQNPWSLLKGRESSILPNQQSVAKSLSEDWSPVHSAERRNNFYLPRGWQLAAFLVPRHTSRNY